MKPLEDMTQYTSRLMDLLDAAGVAVSRQQAELLLRHADAVLSMNQRLNLTRIVDPEDVLMLHIVDSLAWLPHSSALTGSIVDIGTGAGYPGIPLAVLDHKVTLCESVRKKALALEEMVDHLGLDVTVFPLRAEELALRSPGQYERVTARAVSSLGALVELAAPLLCHGGRLNALKGTPDATEVVRAERAAVLCGMRLVGRSEYTLPRGEARTLFEFTRETNPTIELPRRPGMAQRAPLGD